jgi:DNA-binding transcriptional ArsR family regulator
MSLEETADDRPAPELRSIDDVQTLRALAHPVRIALIEALVLDGPMTATQAGARIGETATTCSFHLRQLARYGFVEEAGGGKGRARPWRMTAIGFSLSNTHDDPETDIAATTLSSLFQQRQLARYQTWQETRATYPRKWRDAATGSEYIFYLTADELDQLTEEMHELLMSKFPMERLTDPSKRPAGSVPVELLLFAYPIELPKPGDGPPAEGSER